jgi:hypothetical protein
MPGLTTEPGVVEDHAPDLECDNCGAESPELWHNDRFGGSLCEPCDADYQPFVCSNCGSEWNHEEEAHDCCRHICQSCGAEHRYEDEAYECCWHSCPDCGQRWEYEEDAYSCCGNSFAGSLPILPVVEPYRLDVPEIDGRPARVCSIEQELVAGGAAVARLLYEDGIASSDGVDSYHSGGSRPGTAHVESDGSLPSGGGEVVYDRFMLSDDHDVTNLSRALTKIRQLRDSGSGLDRPVRTGFAAGIHVHISARAVDGTMMTPENVAQLYELWCYAEDMLYAFSAAGWNRHRQPSDHGGYCKPVPKGTGQATPREVWRLMRSDRYYGLNFQRLFEAVGRCSCGAATMADWASCDCGAFDRATIEWRVFNASTRPQTIHAWIVMAQAMTAHAARHPLHTLPENPMGSQTPAEKRLVLEHLLDLLPLTDGERELIRDTADRSPGL